MVAGAGVTAGHPLPPRLDLANKSPSGFEWGYGGSGPAPWRQELRGGEVVELDRAASAPADLLVNGTLIARGEVVVVDEDFGLRISEIVSDAAELGGMAP